MAVLPQTKPQDGEFWYVLDDQGNLVWKPKPSIRGSFYLSWLGQEKHVIGAGLLRFQQGRVVGLCTHGTPYYWLQPHEALPSAWEALRQIGVPGADTLQPDFSLAGWGMRDTSAPPRQRLSYKPLPSQQVSLLREKGFGLIAASFHPERDTPSPPKPSGLLGRVEAPPASVEQTPIVSLLSRLSQVLGPDGVVPFLLDLLEHDPNVIPTYRRGGLIFEQMPLPEEVAAQVGESPRRLAMLLVSAVYHLAPYIENQRLHSYLLLNTLRQRHPFDVTWGADFLVRSLGMKPLLQALLAALTREKDEQVRGNVLDLVQELGYGFTVGMHDQVLKALYAMLEREESSGFGQVITAHLTFLRTYVAAAEGASI